MWRFDVGTALVRIPAGPRIPAGKVTTRTLGTSYPLRVSTSLYFVRVVTCGFLSVNASIHCRKESTDCGAEVIAMVP